MFPGPAVHDGGDEEERKKENHAGPDRWGGLYEGEKGIIKSVVLVVYW
jgi:hypothetical protein